MSIMITGGLGLIGSELCRLLVQKGEDVVVFDMACQNMNRIHDIEHNVKIVRGNLNSLIQIIDTVKNYKVDKIFHLGGMLSEACDRNPWESYQVNLLGTIHILEAARLFNVEQIIFASTQGTYAMGTKGNIDDFTIQRPTMVYGIEKLFCELLGKYYRDHYNIDFRSLRYPSIIGPFIKTPGVAQYNAWMIEHAIAGRNYKCPVQKDTINPIMYYKDAALAAYLLSCAERSRIYTVNYNIRGVSQVMSAGDLEIALQKYYPNFAVEYTITENPGLYKDFNIYSVDDSNACREWGWKPEYDTFDKLIRDFAEVVKAHRNTQETFNIISV